MGTVSTADAQETRGWSSFFDGDPKDPIIKAVIKYWELKNVNHHFHRGEHGGRREVTALRR